MARRSKNKYSFGVNDYGSVSILIENLKKYTRRLEKEASNEYAEEMIAYGQEYADELLGESRVEYVAILPTAGGLSKGQFARYRKRRAMVAKGHTDHDVEIDLDAWVDSDVANRTWGRTNAVISLKGAEAAFVEFGTGVRYNQTEHPEKAGSGMAPIGGYGKGKGSNPYGWVFSKYGENYHTFGIPQAQIIYKTAKYLKSISSASARRAFRGL